MKLIKINTDYYVIVDDSEIKEGDYYLSYMSNKILQRTKLIDIVEVMDKKIIAHLPLNNYPILESVPLLPPIEEDDIEKLAEDWVDKNSHKWSNNNNEVGDNKIL